MAEEKVIRINKVLREFNISLERAVEFLNDKGYLIEPNPNTKISEEEFNILQNQFGSDKSKRQVSNKVSEEKRKEKEALRIEREREIEDRRILDEDWLKNLEAIKSRGHISFPEHLGLINTIKLDQYVNLNKETFENILSFLNSLQVGLFELKIENKCLENEVVFFKQTIMNNEFQGSYSLFRKTINDICLGHYDRKCNFKIADLEVNFLGGKFPGLFKKDIGSIIYQFKESNFFFNNFYNFPENIDEYVLSLLVSKFTAYQCLALLIISNKLKTSNIEKLKKTYTISENTRNEFQKENPFEKEIVETLKGEYANGIILKKISFDNHYLESEFSDFQAFQICRGIKDKPHIFNKFDSNKHDDEDIFEAHSIAMTLLKQKGKNIINFILSIPPLPFKCNNFKILFSSLDKRRDQNENPVVRLKIKNHENATEEIEYSFLMEENTKYINQIRVRNKTTNTELFDVNREGIVIAKENTRVNGVNKNITPILQLFYRITENENGLKAAIFSYGIETGQCSICGRTLTDTVSKMKGIGPVCEKFV